MKKCEDALSEWIETTRFEILHPPPPYACKPFGSYSHLSEISLHVRLLWSIATLHRQVPNYTLSYGAVMVLVQGTLFVHHSDSPIPTLWRLDFSPNERDAQPINLPQPSVELFLIRVSEPSQLLQLHHT